MHIARQAPQFTLKSGRGLAVIEDLRQLVDWYQRLSEHRQILADAAQKESNMFVVTDTSGNPFEDALQHRGSTIYYDGSGDMNDPANYYVGDAPATLQPLAPSRMRHRGSSGPSSALYNHPATDPPERTPYTLPRSKGLVRRRELKAFILWATRSTDPTPAPSGLATRDDLIALARQLAAQPS